VLTEQILFLLFAAYQFASEPEGGGPTPQIFLAIGVAVFVFPASGILGVGWALVSWIKRWEPQAVAAAVLLWSIAVASAICPLYASKWIGLLIRPAVQARIVRAARADHAAYLESKAVHYEALRRRFVTPQKVISAASGGYVRLADGNVIHLLEYGGTKAGRDAFETWAAQNLVGRDVRVVLPERKYFDSKYIPGLRTGFVGAHPIDPETKTPYANIPGIIILDGEIVNERFQRFSGSSRFLREQVAKNM
jgi:hypothetical protein